MEIWRLLPVGAVIGLFIGGAWTYLVYMDWAMRHMDVGMDMWIMPQMVDWDATDLGLVLLMWAVMMAAMMLPSVLPVILVLIRFGRSAHAAGFIVGYLVAWGGFSVAATHHGVRCSIRRALQSRCARACATALFASAAAGC